jgi:hypothetical protein
MSATIVLPPNHPHRVGLEHLRAGDPATAAQYFLQAIEHDSMFADAWHDLGCALLAQNEHQGALLAFNNALHIQPDHAKALANRKMVTQFIAKGVKQLQSMQPVQHLGELSAEDLFELIESYGPDSRVLHEKVGTSAGRDFFVNEFAWAVPNRESIAAIRRFANGDPILEVGSGKGCWAALIQLTGSTVFATDDFSTHVPNEPNGSTGKYTNRQTFTFVERLDHREAIQKYAFCDVLLLCWPPYGTHMSQEALEQFTGSRLVYIGEKNDTGTAITGDKNFHKTLSAEWNLTTRFPIPNWPGIFDAVYFYRRKS